MPQDDVLSVLNDPLGAGIAQFQYPGPLGLHRTRWRPAGDLVLHLQHPDWFFAPDNWPAQEILTRRQLFDRAALENLLVLTYHFAFPGLGHVRAGWRWLDLGTGAVAAEVHRDGGGIARLQAAQPY